MQRKLFTAAGKKKKSKKTDEKAMWQFSDSLTYGLLGPLVKTELFGKLTSKLVTG